MRFNFIFAHEANSVNNIAIDIRSIVRTAAKIVPFLQFTLCVLLFKVYFKADNINYCLFT